MRVSERSNQASWMDTNIAAAVERSLKLSDAVDSCNPVCMGLNSGDSSSNELQISLVHPVGRYGGLKKKKGIWG